MSPDISPCVYYFNGNVYTAPWSDSVIQYIFVLLVKIDLSKY